jgi:predicted esterase
MRTLSIETSTHGRVLVRDAAVFSSPLPWLVGLHGYGQSAEDMLAELERIPGSDQWHLVSIQALHRFYARNEERVIASWMTRQDRELAVADNIAYVDRVLDELVASAPIVFAGFSQGAAMAYRAGVLGRHHARGIIALGGDIPPEVRSADIGRFPWLLIGAGATDFWYTPAKVSTDVAFLESRQIPFEIARFAGGHEWTDEFREAAGAWLARVGVPGRS